MIAPYRKLLSIPRAWQFSLAAFILRLPISMLYLALALFIVDETGSYSLAGALSMASAVVVSIASPLWSRMADRIGQSKVLKITVPIHVIFLALFIYLVKADAPIPLWFLSALVFEGAVIGAGQLVRRRWLHVIGEDRKLIDTAYAYEALIDEFIFTFGPVLATLAAALIAPSAALLTAMVFVIIGSFLFSRERMTEPPAHPLDEAERSGLLIKDRKVRSVFFPMMFCGATFSSTGLFIVGYVDAYGERNLSGLLVSIWSIGSGIAAFVTGAITWKRNESYRYIVTLIGFLLLTTPITLAAFMFKGNLIAMSIALFLNGLSIAPMLAAGFAAAERSVDSKKATEALAWAISGASLGGAIPTAITGYIIDNRGAYVAAVIPLISSALAVVVLLPYWRLWRSRMSITNS
jgi:MFS family permease